jgi:hypothetical protein
MTFQEWKNQIIEKRNTIKRCPLCGGNIEDRTIALFKELVNDLYKVYKQCKFTGSHYFKMKDIKDLLNKNTYARFGDLCRFSGLVFKMTKGNYGLNMERCEKFFRGELEIPVELTINQINNEIVSKKCVTIDKFPELKQKLTVDGMYNYKQELFN